MKIAGLLFFVFFSQVSFATPNQPDTLIFQSDTVPIEFFPLEMLWIKDSLPLISLYKYTIESGQENTESHGKNVINKASDCWRNYVCTWIVESDSLFLLSVKDRLNGTNIPLNRVFEKKYFSEGWVFAGWFSDYIEYGNYEIVMYWDTEYPQLMSVVSLLFEDGKLLSLEIYEVEDDD